MTGNLDTVQWHAEEIESVLIKTDSQISGLTSQEVPRRQIEFGANHILRKQQDGILKLLWRQVNNPLIWVLLGSGSVAILLGKITDGLVVLGVVLVNTIIGFIQEFKAGRAIEALNDMVPQNATVVRDGTNLVVPVTEIVPGDIVLLAAGDRIPADMRLIRQKGLLVEEAALTGESLPVQKSVDPVSAKAVLGDRRSMVFGGTMVTAGTATAVVVATGMATELGKISDMLNKTTDLETPLTHKLSLVGKYLTIGIAFVTLLILIIGTVRATSQGIPFDIALKDSLIFAIALAVGAIPEGLPAVVTIALAIGVQRMAKRKAIIRKLPAVETLGSTTVICTDKTGTLTKNEMTVSEIWMHGVNIHVTGVGYQPDGSFMLDGEKISAVPDTLAILLESATLCNDGDFKKDGKEIQIIGDPTEIALVVAAAKAGIDPGELRSRYPRQDVIPFDSELKYMVTLHAGAEPWMIIKGAPEVVINRCSEHLGGYPIASGEINAQVDRLGSQGMRVLALARKLCHIPDGSDMEADHIRDGFQFLGLMGMIDPPRSEAIEAIKACHTAGIVVKMITGDHRATARSIGMELGLCKEGNVITGTELAEMSDSQLREIAAEVNIFARVAPEHKLKLVKALQDQKHIVAMTGDGVNDAPSLKQANIGVAMGITGTSVSKESADIVLADDNFASIGAAVEEGRRVYDNLLKSLAFILPTNLGLAFILIYGVVFFPFDPVTSELLLPMLPTQLLWINLVAAISLALPLAFEVKEPNVMRRPPRRPDEPLFNRFVIVRVILVSLLMTAGTIALFSYEYAGELSSGIPAGQALQKAQTLAVSFVIAFQIFYMINCRSLRATVKKIGWFSNRFVFVGIGAILVLQTLFIYTPFMQKVFGTTALETGEILFSLGSGFLVYLVIALEKLIRSRRLNQSSR